MPRHLRSCRGLKQAQPKPRDPRLAQVEVEQEEARAPAAPTQANIKEGKAASEVSGETSVIEETSVESLHLVDSSDD